MEGRELAAKMQEAADADRGAADEIRFMCRRLTRGDIKVAAFVGGLLALSNVLVECSEHLDHLAAKIPEDLS